MSKISFLLAAVLLACVWLSQTCLREATSEPNRPDKDKPYRVPDANVIIISIDTLRADRLGCYGYDAPTSPAIDLLAGRGIRFARVIAESSWTLPSHMTMMTGLYPTTHGVTLKAKVLLPGIPTLAQVLREKGYRLYANTCGGFVHGGHGFDRGFEIYDNQMKPLGDTLSQAQTWIEGLKPGEGYFAFLHTFDVHCPYDPPSKYRLMFHTRPMEDHLETRGKCGDTHYNKMSLSQGQVRFLSDMYDADIRAADDALGSFFRFLETRGAFKDTVLILLSDHGEEFKEHGRIGHERTLYIESLMVPLIITAPGLRPRVVQEGVGLADVMPTVLEMLGVESPPVEGRSLLPLMVGSGRSRHEGPLFSELDRHVRLRSIAHDQYHLIVNTTEGKRELYNLKTDPTEQSNLIHGLPDKAENLEQMLGVHFDNLSKPQKSLDRTLSTEQIEKLRSLGYVD